MMIRTDFIENDSIALITMQNGENRLSIDFFVELNTALNRVERNPEVKALITTGDGKFYSNGIDLQRLAENPDQLEEFFRIFSATLRRLICFPVVTIAAINGHAFAGGCLLALSHDLRVMKTEHGWISMNEIFIQRLIPESLLAIIRCKIPPGPVQHSMVVFGKRFTAKEALKEGIINRTSPGEALLSESIRLVKEIVGKQEFNREMLHDMKSSVYHHTVHLLDEASDSKPQSKL